MHASGLLLVPAPGMIFLLYFCLLLHSLGCKMLRASQKAWGRKKKKKACLPSLLVEKSKHFLEPFWASAWLLSSLTFA